MGVETVLKAARIVLPLLLAALLIVVLIARSGLSYAEFIATLREISPAAVAGIIATTALFVLLSSLKWQLVMGHVATDEASVPGWGFSLYYTGLGAVLALVIPPQAAMVLSRSVGTKFRQTGSALAAGASSAYEQIFDIVPLLTMSLAALLAIAVRSSFGEWLAIVAGLNAAALLAMILLFKSRFWALARFLPLPQRRREPLREKLEWFATPAARTLLGAPLVTTLFAISLARYVVILMRTAFVMASVSLPIGAFQFLKAYGVARLSSLISITPGELGIAEWTWSGVLSWMGFHLEDAARFVLANRVSNIASLLAVFAPIWLIYTIARIGGASSQRKLARG